MNPFRSAAAVLALLFAGCISTVGEGGSGTGSGTPGSGATGAASTGAGAGGTATGATSSGQVGTSSGGGTSGGATTAGPTSGGSTGGPGSGGSTGGNCNADLQTDPDNCGACGNVCPMPCSPGPTCNAFQGVCANGVCGCAAGYSLCPAVGGQPSYCADLTTDAANCGACGAVCPGSGSSACGPQAYAYCNAGACDGCTTSPPGQPEGFPGTAELCTNADGSTYCANIGLDPLNCGGCGVVCSATERCESTGPSRNAPASCQSSGCPSGETFCPPQQNPACGDVCTALDSDPANCGACGHACGTNESCVQGSCS